jgi:hypothetical protein
VSHDPLDIYIRGRVVEEAGQREAELERHRVLRGGGRRIARRASGDG